MAQGITGESLKQAFNDFQAYRRAGKIVVDYSLLSSIAMHFTAKNSPKTHEIQEFYLRNLVAPLNTWMSSYNIDTAIRAAHFLSQACGETFQYTAFTEKPMHGGKEYNGRKSLGNVYPGDGPTFIGRGLLHLTGRKNYTDIGKNIGEDIVSNPNIVANDINIAVRTACDYWKVANINRYADKDDFDLVMILVNGGHNGREERYKALQRAKKKLGLV